MYTWGQLKSDIRQQIFPSGEAENLVVAHDKYFIDAIIDIQTWVECQQQDNTDIRQQCETFYQCGLTVMDAPRGNIKQLTLIDKINPETKQEDADSPDDWCSAVNYVQVDFVHVKRYMAVSRSCGRCLAIGTFFGLPYRFGRPTYPTPTDADVPAGLPPLDLGFHYPQESTNRNWGRAGAGVWALDRGKIYIAPWIQTTETAVIKWDGIKRTWGDADPIDPDPLLSAAISDWVRWKNAEIFDRDTEAATLAANSYTVNLAKLIHQCREETRTRNLEGSKARQASTLGSQTTSLYYNDQQSASAQCPDDTTGDPVSVTISAGVVGSNVSVADANAKAMAQAQEQAQAQLVCTANPTTYWNVAMTATAACDTEEGAPIPVGNPVTVTTPANTYSSTISQTAANDIAYAAALASARSQRQCTYGNKEVSYTASCPSGSTGADVTVTIAAGTYTSTLSQQAADDLATAAATNQAIQEVGPGCTGTPPYYTNTPQQGYWAILGGCHPAGAGGIGSGASVPVQVAVIMPAGSFYAASLASANITAQAAATSFAQQVAAYRVATGQCGAYSTTYPNP